MVQIPSKITPEMIAEHGLTEEEAYLALRSESRRLRKPMREVAEAIGLAEEMNRKGKRRDESSALRIDSART